MAQWLARWALDRRSRDPGQVVTTVTTLSRHRVTAVGKLLTLNCLWWELSVIYVYSFIVIERLQYVICL